MAAEGVLREAGVTSAIVGATKLAHVDDNVKAGDLSLDPAIFEEMNRILAPVLPYEPYLA